MSILREELITNHLLLDYFDLWDEFNIKSANDTQEVRYYNQLMNLINGQLDAGIRWLDSDEAEQYFKGESKYQREVFQALEDEWDEILSSKYSSVDALLSEVYRRGKAKGYADMRTRIRYTEQDKLALAFAREYNFGLIQIYDDDVRNQIKNKITEAIVAGDHPNTLAPKILSIAEERLDGSNFTPKQRATMIARTEISRVQNTGVLQSYVNEGYTEVKLLTAEDDHVCDLCLRYAFEFNDNDNITFENRGEERVHNIFKLIKNGNYPPFHPVCRCTYMSVWESKGKIPNDASVVKLVSQTAYDKLKERQYVRGIRKKTSNRFNPKEVAQKYNMDYYIDDNGNHVFYDKEFKTNIVIDKFYVDGKSFLNNFIDFTNSGKSRYDLEEIMMIYHNAPKIYKMAPNEIVFTKQPKGNNYKNITGETIGFDSEFNFINQIRIYPQAFKTNRLHRGNFAQTLYHEMGHCIDKRMANIKQVHALRNLNQYSPEELSNIFKEGPLYILSEGDEFTNARNEDKLFQEKNHFPVEESSWYGDESEFESLAELFSMFAFESLDDKTMAVMQTKSGEVVSFEDWKKRNPHKYKFISEKIKQIEEKGFNLKNWSLVL